ncbi:purine and uridine phosphorylase [Aspergillus sclerotiicarbonarius CBS 121057]|uniref:Purine and uridine phosphorylase n=1 Tax=Aspergillus sclerotiicarbonarius (strain CBS 121057 / IBT 28362) TaxID=1448318 RepID=A0A319EQG6_ASPSB|nr:purine and uridine phosphorylase [Aspergillus sclerotiicarbonarius CBS 121057]
MVLTQRLTPDDYKVACICPMDVEQAPVEAMLDEIHPALPTTRDMNSYTLGRMGVHYIVIAAMPDIGNNSAAAVATQLMNDFRSIRFSLLIGIGGGIPNLEHGIDIRLGDVIVSKPSGIFGGVIQFDRGKALTDNRFERTGVLQKPPDVLLAAVSRLKTLHRRVESKIPTYLQQMTQKYPRMIEEYNYQSTAHDQLFRSGFEHSGGNDCHGCDPAEAVTRVCRPNTNPAIHYGTIGSSNAVIKNRRLRDMLRDELNIQCVEMEAAGLLNSYPCLVIRGICDYADSHKNKRWQPYAAATAAACAKELLSLIPALGTVSSKEDNNTPARGSPTIHMGNLGNFVYGSVAGDMVAGDKFMR